MAEPHQLSDEARERLTLVVHELRAPLTVIRGYMQLLDRPLDDEARLNAADSASRASNRLEILLDDLTAAVSDPGVFAPAITAPVDIRALAEEAAGDLRPLTDHQIAVTGEPLLVSGDQNRLRQVLDNLLSNAIKHTGETGAVSIDIEVSAQGKCAVLSVEDSGPGIDPEDRERVFDLFERLEAGQREGLGLGLTIARAIAEGHGGALRLDDPRLGSGARFVVDLPLWQ